MKARGEADTERAADAVLRDSKHSFRGSRHPPGAGLCGLRAVQLGITEANLILKDWSTAETVLSTIQPTSAIEVSLHVLRARIAFGRGDLPEGRSQYRKASTLSTRHGPEVLAELGGALNSVGEHAEALTVFEELGTNLPEIARKAYATALYKNNNLEKAQALIDDLLSKGSQPDWALALAVDIALRQENHEQALKYLTLLSARGATTTSAELVLCQCLLETGQDQAALLRLERLVKSKLSPVDRMNAASLLQFTGQEKPALNLALQAFRQGSTAPNLHRALITIALRCKEPPLTTNQVADCTHVRLVSSNGEYRDHVVFSEGPWDPVRRLRKIKFLFRPNRPFDTTCFHD